MNPLISIIVPCYNQAQFLPEALQSVLEQTYDNWECIVVNDGSPDSTHEVAQKWLAKDNRFKYIQKENGGLSTARNAGIKSASGEFILPLDADDKISTQYCELAIQQFNENNKLKVVYCQAEKFGSEFGLLELKDFSISGLAIRNLIFCSAFYRKKDWELVGGYDEKMIYGLEDWEFWICVLKTGGDVYKIKTVCFFYRIKQVSMATELTNEKLKKMYEYMSIKHVEFFVQQLGSFKFLLNENLALQSKLNSEKYIINMLSQKIFRIKIFKNVKN